MSESMKTTLNELCQKGYCNCFRRRTLYSPSETCAGTESETDKTSNWQKLYYISAEFLIGKLLSNNLINLGLYDEVRRNTCQCTENLLQISKSTAIQASVPVPDQRS